LFICEVQPNSVAHKAGLLVGDKIFSVSFNWPNYLHESMTNVVGLSDLIESIR
jgi:C-terminal processing protease CtpA/Prc